MKRINLFLFSFLVIVGLGFFGCNSESSNSESSNSEGSWKVVGADSLSLEGHQFFGIAVDSNGTPYAGLQYNPKHYNGPSEVMKFNGNKWVTIGENGFIPNEYILTDLALDSDDTPYVVYNLPPNEGNTNNKSIPVMKYDGESWVSVGNTGLSVDEVMDPQIAFDSEDTPYVVYTDCSKSETQPATVKKLNGDSWVTVGKAGFSTDDVIVPDIAFDSKDTPYVIYSYVGDYLRIVKKYDGDSWTTIGDSELGTKMGYQQEISVDSNDTLYFAISMGRGESMVVKYDGDSWVSVGENNILTSELSPGIDIAIDSSDTPYVVFAGTENREIESREISVKKLYNGRWVSDLDGDGDDDLIKDSSDIVRWGMGTEFDIAIDSSNTPYVIYQDNSPKYDVVVVKFE